MKPIAAVEGRINTAIGSLYRWLERYRLTRVPWAVIQTYSRAQGALLAGSMAYYAFLSLLPLLMVGGFVLGTLSQGDPALQAAFAEAMQRVFPGADGQDLVEQLIDGRAAFGLVGLVAAGYAASGFVGAFTASLNQMWDARQGRNPVGQKLLNILVVTLMVLVLLASVGLTLWVAYLTRITLRSTAAGVVRQVELLASPVALFLVLLLLYKLLPARRLSWRSQVPGAVFGATAIELLKRAFTFWAQHSAGVSALPRSLLSVVLLLVWLGLLGQIILYGAAINVVWDRRKRKAPLLPGPDGP